MVDGALQRVDDALSELADKAESDRNYATYFEAQGYLRHQRANLKRRFLRNLGDTAALFQDASRDLRPAAERSFDPEKLQILGDRDLEEALVLGNMVSKAETRYIRPLGDLTRHFAHLVGRTDLSQRDIPISPTAIANAFAAGVRAMDALELSTVLVVHKIFDQQVMDHLDAFYADCVEFAVTQGLVPTSRRRVIVKDADDALRDGTRALPTDTNGVPAAADSTRARANSEPAGATAIASGVGACTFEALRRMLAGARPISDAGPSQAMLATQELIALLSRVQPEAAEQAADTALAPKVLRHAVGDCLRASMEAAQPPCLAPDDEDTMDLVFLLFEQLLSGADMPSPIKALVSRLQIPYVKVALLDRGFFDEPQHPARAFLNRVAEASIGWNESDLDQGDELYARIDHLVQRVVTELHTDPELFTKLERELADHVDGTQARAASAEQRVVQQAATRNARRSARRRALLLLDQRVRRRADLPRIVRIILEDGWLEAMVQADADGGEQGHGWRAGECVLDDLLWSVAPKRDAAERRELLRRIPQLLRDLRACLGAVITDQQRMARWLKELQTVHIAVLRGHADSGQAGEEPEHAVGRAGASETAPDVSRNDADALPIGCWLGVARDDGSIQRFKLAWRGEVGDPLLFVDRLGRKGFELPKPDLEALIAQELATVIGTGARPLVDRAMEAVRQSLSIR